MLGRGLSAEEAFNLDQSAVTLERAQATSIGKGIGAESTSLWKGIGKAVAGNPLAIGGGVAGALIEGLHGAEVGAFAGMLIQSIGSKMLVNAMTRSEGVAALRALKTASTAEMAAKAIQSLKVAGAAGASQPRRGVAAALTPSESE